MAVRKVQPEKLGLLAKKSRIRFKTTLIMPRKIRL